MRIFDCPRHKVDAAQNWHKVVGPLHEQKKIIFSRRKLIIDHAKHFFRIFVYFRINAYGSTTLVYSNGEKQALPKSILKMTKNHTIEAYKQYCLEMNIPVKISNSSLWAILNEVKPGQCHALAGLGNVTAAGLRAFSVLMESIKKLPISPTIMKELDVSLEKGKRYLKTSFSYHCSDDAETATHCISHALYNPTDSDFQGKTCQKHLKTCVNCMELLSALETITEGNKLMVFSEEKEELTYGISKSVETILSWMAHLLRGLKQNEAKQHAISILDEIKGLWLSDWVQKIIPVSFREGQNEYFQKNRMSLANDILFTKNIGTCSYI